jgi:hypothetical protein
VPDLTLSVSFVGQHRWPRVLADGINSLESPQIKAVAVPLDQPITAFVPSTVRALMQADLVVRVGFRPGSDGRFGKSIEWYFRSVRRLNQRAPIVIYWIGTDVAYAREQVRSGRGTRALYRVANEATHFAGSQPLVTELASIGIPAMHVGFPWTVDVFPDVVPILPEVLTVLTYIPDSEAEFYGGPQIVEAARALPQVSFNVIGGDGVWLAEHPPNVHFRGWQQRTDAWYRDANVVVRLVQHDSIGGTVIEGLLYGRHVVYSESLPHTQHVSFGDSEALIAALSSLAEISNRGELQPNTVGRDFAAREFGPSRRREGLSEALLSVAERTR